MIQFGVNISINDTKVLKALKIGESKALERAGLVIEKEWKRIVTKEDHIITGLYRNSINSTASDGEGIHEWSNDSGILKLRVGTAVEYAIYLERNYGMGVRSLDASRLGAYQIMEKTILDEFK